MAEKVCESTLCFLFQTYLYPLHLKVVFVSVVLDDPRKTVYKKVNRGRREIDPSQVYFSLNGGKIQTS
jgi:hypothetical protein